ncbi:lipid acyl hydrolase [Colletotrichum truncatum]|uniref:Lipid acyl hydrolase n=1 Tax=Colletotrichum truncatum TaxID=5467 RepID=A0ACC3Z535_COLTU|nr:lipid acyl hydrolase [Colletotrichum truncatum]KAF6780860.1 lipid acyl hydrolase [Colletotrichum truncatum]
MSGGNNYALGYQAQLHHGRSLSFNGVRPVNSGLFHDGTHDQHRNSLDVPVLSQQRRSVDAGLQNAGRNGLPRISPNGFYAGGNLVNHDGTAYQPIIGTNQGTGGFDQANTVRPASGLQNTQNMTVENWGNFSRQDFRRVISAAFEMYNPMRNPNRSTILQSARMLLSALTREHIRDLPRTDLDIICAKEHLGACYFLLGEYSESERFRREILQARENARPPDLERVLAARQNLVASLLEVANERAKTDAQSAYTKNYEALNLAVKNACTRRDQDRGIDEDFADVLQCCNRLLKNTSISFHEKSNLLTLRIRALLKGNDEQKVKELRYEVFEDLTNTRLDLAGLYGLNLNKHREANATYNCIEPSIQIYRSSMQQGDLYSQQRIANLDNTVKLRWKMMLQQKREDIRKAQEQQERQNRLSNAALGQDIRRPETSMSISSNITMISRSTSILLDVNLPSNDVSAIQGSKKRMYEFIQFRKSILAGRYDPNMQPIRLTVIDTGLDDTHPFISNSGWKRNRDSDRKALFKDFEGDSVTPVDEDGHGTFIAGIVLQIAPEVELSVARICKNHSSIKTDQAVEEKIARAIVYAVDVWQTNIISLSLGFERPSSGNLQAAISKVQQNHNVILLCATGNSGNEIVGPLFPAKSHGIFKIFATDHSGVISNISTAKTSDSDFCFSVLGCNIESTWPSAPELRERAERNGFKVTERMRKGTTAGLWTVMSGTSFATPVAASLVAILFQFYDENAHKVRLRQGVFFKTVEVLKRVLLSMSNAGRDGYNHLVPTKGRGDDFNFINALPGETRTNFFARRLTEVVWRI